MSLRRSRMNPFAPCSRMRFLVRVVALLLGLIKILCPVMFMQALYRLGRKTQAQKRKKMKKVFCEYSCFLARGGQRAACQKCQGKNAKGKILLFIIIILLGLFVIIYGKVYLLLFMELFIATKKRRDPKTSPFFYVSLLFYYEHTNYLYFILLLCL